MDFEKKSLPDLKQMQLNYERLNKTETADYRTLIATIDRRGANGLDRDKTTAFLRQAAAESRFVSYKDVAAACGVVWDNTVRLRIGAHLDDITRAVVAEGGPLLGAIVVNQPNVVTGKLEPVALRGFLKLVVELRGEAATAGRTPATVLAEAQAEVFRSAAVDPQASAAA